MISDCTFDAGTSWTSIGHYLNMYTNILYFKELGWGYYWWYFGGFYQKDLRKGNKKWKSIPVDLTYHSHSHTTEKQDFIQVGWNLIVNVNQVRTKCIF